jgi:glycine/D-amino acid oxidase-like deaminating enzyme
MTTTRRTILGAATAALPLAACSRPAPIVVVGAGVFGAWTAEHLRRLGKRVLLVDQMGPANARASSGGESRMTRGNYGADEIYTRMALASLAEWKRLSDRSALPLFHQAGVLMCFQDMIDYARQSIAVHERLRLPLENLDTAALRARWPQMNFDGIAFGLFEPEFGALMARRAVEELVARFVAAGGEYQIALATPGADGHSVMLDGVLQRSEAIIWACGPWLPKVFPDLLGERIFVTRQEVAFIAPPDGDDSFEATRLPGWADFNNGDLYYGFPNLEGRGFKIARDTHGPEFDPDTGDRRITEDGAALLRAFAERRFPALAGRPFTEFRVCQYENSSNGDFLIDRHPSLDGAYLLGGGSGHGFKHGPEVGRLMAELVVNGALPDARFSLASKQTIQNRTVL